MTSDLLVSSYSVSLVGGGRKKSFPRGGNSEDPGCSPAMEFKVVRLHVDGQTNRQSHKQVKRDRDATFAAAARVVVPKPCRTSVWWGWCFSV